MAKKSKKPAKKPAKKSKKPARKAASTDPHPVTTGKGATVAEIGKDLVALFNAGKADEPGPKWWSKDIVSIESGGMAWHGRKAVDAKNAWWSSQYQVLGGSADGPYLGSTGFAVRFDIEVKENATGKVTRMTEIGVYTVKNGKITVEEFMYGQ